MKKKCQIPGIVNTHLSKGVAEPITYFTVLPIFLAPDLDTEPPTVSGYTGVGLCCVEGLPPWDTFPMLLLSWSKGVEHRDEENGDEILPEAADSDKMLNVPLLTSVSVQELSP